MPVVVLVLCLVAAPSLAQAQPSKMPRIGVLEADRRLAANAFQDGLRQFGYVERQNIAIEWRSADGRAERLPQLAAELVRLKVEIIVATNNPAVAAAQAATTTIPM